MTTQLGPGIVKSKPQVQLSGDVECFGMIQRGGEVVKRMLENVQQGTIEPLVKAAIVSGSLSAPDEYGISNALNQWGYEHKTVGHGAGEDARDDDGDGVCEVHVNTMAGFWSL